MTNDNSARVAWGVDGCKGGWFYFRLPLPLHTDLITWGVVKTLGELMEMPSVSKHDLILVDIPISLPSASDPRRGCDEDARKVLRAEKPRDRSSSVFAVPVREVFVGPGGKRSCPDKPKVMRLRSCVATQGEICLSRQTFGILKKIDEVDRLLYESPNAPTAHARIRETHPEVCFWALNGEPMRYPKKGTDGRKERIGVLPERRHQDAVRSALGAVYEHCSECIRNRRCDRHRDTRVARDDVIDAMVCAVTARIILDDPKAARAFPHREGVAGKPKPPEIVYALPQAGTSGPSSTECL